MTWGDIGTLASILGAFIGASAIVQAVLSSRTVKALHADTQETLRQLGAGVTTMDTGLKQVLDRMDERAEARYRDLKDRLGGAEDTPA
jgi:hypothetical protein